MKKFLFFVLTLTVLCLTALLSFKMTKDDKPVTINNSKVNLIRVETPKVNEMIGSPLVVRGEARGYWFFEGSFPVRLFDSEGNELAVSIAQARGEWMTTEFVPFETKLIFISPQTSLAGTLVLEKDNPSDMRELDDELRMPVRFRGDSLKTRIIKLYFYNASKDKDSLGNILCSEKGLAPVEREILLTLSPIKDSINLLLQGDLAFTEKGRGIDTEFPLDGFKLKSASLSNGIVTLDFVDPQNKSGGGSCRVNILRAQIEATAKQFDGVTSVVLTPSSILQP